MRRPDGSKYAARDICFTNDVQFFDVTQEGLERTADPVSTYALVFNLPIAAHKLRASHYHGLILPTTDSP